MSEGPHSCLYKERPRLNKSVLKGNCRVSACDTKKASVVRHTPQTKKGVYLYTYTHLYFKSFEVAKHDRALN